MSKEVVIYVSAFLGMTGIMGVFAFMIYRKNQRHLQHNLAYIQTIHDRRQQAIDLNLPPFYVDHVRDPVVHDHAPTLEAVVVESGNGQIYSPSSRPSSPSTSSAYSSRNFAIAATDLESNLGGRESILPPLTRPRVTFSSMSTSSSSSSAATALATAPISSPSFVPVIVPEEIDLSDLPPPPSYDVPNTVVERSPTLERSPTSEFTVPTLSLALGSNSSALLLSLSPSLAATFVSIASTPEGDEVSALQSIGNANNSTVLEAEQIRQTPPSGQQHHHQHQRHPSDDGSDFETPRYSAEFDPNVPHEVHLQQYRRARALSDASTRPSLASITQLNSGPSVVVVSS
ncbi:hypothetical protein BGZ93_003520 [Podila epicladia]|nr:hypothetical protein BGZ92_007401 [Podila epicladia]KAG0097035.1 hypothetical protein BGZ93_003520 [Podila epicladia]